MQWKVTGSEAFQPLPFSAATTAWCEVGYVKTYPETQMNLTISYVSTARLYWQCHSK